MECSPEPGFVKGSSWQNCTANPDWDGAYVAWAWADKPARHTESHGPSSAASGEDATIAKRFLVTVVDDDESVRESLPDLLKELGFEVQAFSSAEAFLRSDYVDQTRCLILDIAMPGMSGPDLQRELIHRQKKIPIVFITAHRAESVRPNNFEHGAVACLLKPFSDTALLDAVNTALFG